MKKFLSILVAVVIMTTLVMPITASAKPVTDYRVYLIVTDSVPVASVPNGWEKVGDVDGGVKYKTTSMYPETDSASTYYNQWTEDNFTVADGAFVGFTDTLGTKTLGDLHETKTLFNVIKQLDVTAPAIEEGQDAYSYPISYTTTPEETATGYEANIFKFPAGTVDLVEAIPEMVESGETFDKAYDYYVNLTCEATGGYTFTDDTVCHVNGVEHDYSHKFGDSSVTIKLDFKTAEPATEATTTAAPTTTSPKTGDAENPMLYVIALIAVIATAGVTVFATRKK